MFYFILDQATSIQYVEIGGVNSVVTATSPNAVPNPPYSVMHTFTAEDFASEDVASLTVHYSTEETFPPQTPVSGDSSHGICFPFSANDTYTTSSHNNTVFTTGTPLPSPGVHYVQASMEVEASEELGPNDESSSTRRVSAEGYVIRKQNPETEAYIVQESHLIREPNSNTDGYMVREQSSANEEYMVQDETSPSNEYIVQDEHNTQEEQTTDSRDYIQEHMVQQQEPNNQSYIVQEPTSPGEEYIMHRENPSPAEYIEQSCQRQEYIAQGESSERGKSSEDLTLPTMVVFTSSEDDPATPDVSNGSEETSGDGESSETNLGALTLRQRCESTSIGQFAPPSIIFQVSIACFFFQSIWAICTRHNKHYITLSCTGCMSSLPGYV